MNRITLSQVVPVVAEVMDMCSTDSGGENGSNRVINYINEAQRRLLNRGRWVGTYARIQITAYMGIISWPRSVAVPEQVNVCQSPIPMKNQWYEFLEFGIGSRPKSTFLPPLKMISRGYALTAYDIPSGVAGKLKFYASIAADVTASKLITVQGIGTDGNRIRTEYPPASGVYIDGEVITINANPKTSVNDFVHIDGIQKQITSGNIKMTVVDSGTGLEFILADYEPSETNPYYARTILDPFSTAAGPGCTAGSGCGNTHKSVTAMVKLSYYPALVDTDWMVISNIDAIKQMVLALRKEKNNEFAESLALTKLAVKELNHELRTETGDRVSAQIQVHGSAKLGYKRIGRLI